MKKRSIGKSSIQVSELTLGCMSIPNDEKQAHSMIDQALSYGINHLDTADLYGFGHNEEIIGNYIQSRRDQIILTSKGGNHFNKENQSWYWDPSPQYIEEALHASLRRLKTDYLDFYLLHGGTIDDPIDETIHAFENLKVKGLIRAYGISSIRPNVIKQFVEKSSIDCIMMQYNMLDRRPEDLFPYLKENDIHVLARGPLAKGILTDQGPGIVKDKGRDGYLSYDERALAKVIDQLIDLTDGQLTAASLAYILHEDTIGSAVFGASSTQQIDEVLKAYHIKQDQSLMQDIKALTKDIQYNQHLI